jgi:predicted  nucleic acid-binding Zn-ribbon protein
MPAPAPDPHEQADLLRRLLDHDRVVEALDGEIRAAAAELREMRRRRKDAAAARAKLSAEIRRPTPILETKGST